MRIAVMGAGGVGGYFGGLLARAGNDVTLIARGAHLEAIRAKGLHVKSPQADFSVEVEATDEPKEVDAVELVILTVKTYQNDVAIPAMAPLIGEHTSLLTFQNGVDSYKVLARAVGQERVLPGATYIAAQIESPGVILHRGDPGRIVFGETDGQRTPRAQRILETFRSATIPTELSDDVVKERWTKSLLVGTLGPTTTAARTSVSRLMQHPEARDMVLSVMKETEAVARASGVKLDADAVDKTMQYVEASAKNLHASMRTDVELGRPLELDAVTGAVVRLGREVGAPTPVNSVLYSILVAHKDGAMGS